MDHTGSESYSNSVQTKVLYIIENGFVYHISTYRACFTALRTYMVCKKQISIIMPISPDKLYRSKVLPLNFIILSYKFQFYFSNVTLLEIYVDKKLLQGI